MRRSFLVLVLLLSGCAAQFDPKTDPDIAKIVDFVNKDHLFTKEIALSVNAMAEEINDRHPGSLKRMEAKRLREIKANEGKS